ncbi:MAG: 7-carboxy-7-deazaguanine synthase QueE [Acidaminococcales bacterium]|jgi:organic radical activating enzyme|nr:7-carboxy-7-deazaguanine synthase QueE [Acidaminococcales bacterium]
MSTFLINEIFYSLQGEGFNTGRPAVFIRLSGCNLHCVWCDTDFAANDEMDIDAILSIVRAFEVKNVVITGGEPTMHENLLDLARLLKSHGYWLALETNGVNGLPEEAELLFNYISVSPKSFYASLYENASAISFADEVRVVVDGDVFDFCVFIEDRIVAQHYYLSPCCSIDEKFNVLPTIQTLGKLNMRKGSKKWGLSFQTHKMADMQ